MNPYKGSEDGLGWNWALQVARFRKLILITRKNNRPHIERYIAEHPELDYLTAQITFSYFDLPYWTRFWKKGPNLALIYFYMWQCSTPFFIRKKKFTFDIAYNLNFHTDWIPTFLWTLKKPFIWGPIGHHPLIPRQFILKPYGRKQQFRNLLFWNIKKLSWALDPFMKIAASRASAVICMNSEAGKHITRMNDNVHILPAAASRRNKKNQSKLGDEFIIMSVGRFVPLKGFDLTIGAFAASLRQLEPALREKTRLVLIGSGPLKQFLKNLAVDCGVEKQVEFIPWMPQEQLFDMYARASVFLFPSHEGAGMVVPEAMSFGLPVVCIDNSGPGELVHPNSHIKVHYSTYENTIDRLGAKLTRLRTDPEFMQSEIRLAQERYEECLTWESKGELLNKIFNSIYAKLFEENIRRSPAQRFQRKPAHF